MISGPKAVIGLSTGQTPLNAYANITRIFKACPCDLSGVTVFNVDQVTNVPRESPYSCYDMLKSQLTGPIGLPEGNLLMPPPFSDDSAATAKRSSGSLRVGAALASSSWA